MPAVASTFSQTVDSVEVHSFSNGKLRQNAYVVRAIASESLLVIDPGSAQSELMDYLRAHSKYLNRVLLTHGHFDHVGGLAAICKEFGVSFEVHRADARLVRQAPFWAIKFIKQKIDQPPNPSLYQDGADDGIELQLSRPLEGQMQSLIRLYFTPGHTQGGVVIQVGLAIFTGDTLFRERIGPTDYVESDAAKLVLSIEKLLKLLPEEGVLFPGHGTPWTVREARLWWDEHRHCPPAYNIMQDASLRWKADSNGGAGEKQ